MYSPGDVVWLWSAEANKPKYHLCICSTGKFLFINSPKAKSFPGDFSVPCSDIPCLPPTPEGNSIISCTLVIPLKDAELKKRKAEKKGTVASSVLLRLCTFVDNATFLSQDDKDAILNGLGDWL
jgi:hypothetical protein